MEMVILIVIVILIHFSVILIVELKARGIAIT